MSNFVKQRNLMNGAVIQSVYSANSYQTINNGTSYQDILSALATPWEISITPKSSTSVINLMANFQANLQRSTNGAFCGIRIQRKIGAGAYSTIFTPVTDSTGAFDYGMVAVGASSIVLISRYQLLIRDAPSTTSTVTYKFQISNR